MLLLCFNHCLLIFTHILFSLNRVNIVETDTKIVLRFLGHYMKVGIWISSVFLSCVFWVIMLLQTQYAWLSLGFHFIPCTVLEIIFFFFLTLENVHSDFWVRTMILGFTIVWTNTCGFCSLSVLHTEPV